MIASHYAEAVERRLAERAVLRAGPSERSEAIRELLPEEPFLMLDDTLGWAWGYAGEERRVGYVPGGVLRTA